MLRRLLVLILLVLGSAMASAQVQYAQKSTPIKAGVLLVDSYKLGMSGSLYDANGAPFVWYNLEHSNGVKPADWSFVNPHAATVMTQSIMNRWDGVLGSGSGLDAAPPNGVGGNVAGIGQILTKASAPYWEVSLGSSSDSQLADYDVLSLSVRGSLSLTPFEREKLRAYIDQGGVLWVDVDNSTAFDAINNIPLAIDKSMNPGGPIQADLAHPILTTPNQVTIAQVAGMEMDGSSGFRAVDPTNYGGGSLIPVLETLQPEFTQFQTVASDASGTLIGVARIGDGFLVVTARGVADALNKGVLTASRPTDTGNQQFYALAPSLDAQSNAAASLIVNAISLGSSYRESFFGSRKANASPVDLHAPLLRTFFAPLPLSPGNRNFVPPATYKGVFVVSANDRIYVYDASPTADLDGDGNPDDGLPETDLSSGLDLLWTSQTMPSPISAPSCVSVQNPTGSATKDQILVVDANGTVHAFNPFCFMQAPAPADLSNVSEEYNVTPPGGSSDFDFTEDGRGPFAPTIHNGIAYISDTQSAVTGRVGRLWLLDPSAATTVNTGPNPWVIGGSSSTGIPESSGPATVGYIPVQDNSGGQDLVAYIPTRANPTALGSPDQTCGITSVWIGAKGERPQDVQVVGSSLEVTTRANLAGLKIYLGAASDPLGIKVSVFRSSTGQALDAATLASVLSGTVTQGPDGVLQLGLNGAWDPDYSLRLDYMIDWGSGSLTLTEQVRRGSLFFPDAARTRRVIGAVALASNGSIFATVSDQAKGGALFAFREEGRGLFRLLYRYELYDAHQISLSAASPVNYRETFINEDPVTTLVPFFAGPLSNLTMEGAPSVHNGMVFATATARVGTFSLPVTILMAFKASPEPVKIPVGNLSDTFVLVQPDIARSVNPTEPETFTIMQPTQFTYEQQGNGGYVKIDNLMASRTGTIQQALSSSQPVILRQSGLPDQLIEPDGVGGSWSPLMWYTMLEGTDTQSPTMVTGNTVFVGGNSKLPDILSNIPPGSATDRGVMFAMDADVQPLPPDAYPNSLRPWMIQVPMLTTSGGNISPNPVIRWPQTSGLTLFEDWKVRYFQTALRPGDTSYGVAAGDGSLFTWGASTLYGFSRGDLMVADEGRLVRLDASGNPEWASDTSIGAGSNAQQTNTSTTRSLVRPVRAYRLGSDQMVIADPGGNRVVRMNLTGKELRSLSKFLLDPTYRPDGYVSSESTTLDTPSDVATYSAYVTSGQNFLSNPNALEYWVYYLVADSGNKRLIQVVDRYIADPSTRQILGPVEDVNNVQQLGVLTWHSPSNYTGKQFSYNSVARVFNPATGRFTYAGGIGNATPTPAGLGLDTTTTSTSRDAISGNGGIVLFDGAQTVVIHDFTVPAISANMYYNETTKTFISPATNQRIRPIGHVTSVTMRYVSVGGVNRLAVMFTDSSGVYELYQPTVGQDLPWVVRWELPREMYKSMRRDPTTNIPTGANPRDLTAMFARRLDSGEVIVVNGYMGKTRGQTQFSGEVVVLNGDSDPAKDNTQPGFDFGKQNFGFSNLSVRLQLSQLTGIRSITAPVFADLR